jgi:molybdate transport system substrate-binding protein
MTPRPFMRAIALIATLIVATNSAQAAEIQALITTAMKAAIDELLPKFEGETGNTVGVSYGPSGGIARRFIGGEPADVIVIDSGALDDLIRQGKVLPDPTRIASTGIGICVRKGAPRPDVSTPDALKRALLAAKSIAHTAPAGGGITAAHIMKLFERLGSAAEVTPQVKLAAGVLVSSGEAEIGLQQVSELMSNPDVDVIGMLPAELQQITTYAAGITASAKEPEAAKALIKALTAPATAAVFKAKGLDQL